ncbi:MAG: type I-A CRISPR-associated protein CsaX [Sulfolobaceae archaeon]|nr:type I-A CRISPR-associated protein CsaX [Sulfolobaceae archaeon]
MKVPLYGIFGDNFIITIASLSKNVKRVGNEVEFDDKELRDVVILASQIAKEREGKGKFVFPLSGNDKKAFSSALKCYNIPDGSPVSSILDKFANSLDKECEEVSAISTIKPEFYEFARSPGYSGGRKAQIKVEPKYVLLSLAGWVISRLGRAPLGQGDYVSVHAFPVDIDQRFGVIPSLLKELSSGLLPGTEPITALTIWLASKMVKTQAIIDQMFLYFISDPAGQNPATITSGHLISVKRIVENEKFKEINGIAEVLADYALNPNPQLQCDIRSFSIRVINLLFEVLNGSKSDVELLYFTNRELFSLMNARGVDERCMKEYRMASIMADKLVS